MPTAETNCATCSVSLHLKPPPNALSGTMTVSPGWSAASSAPPVNAPPLPPTTEPSARTTKIPFLSEARAAHLPGVRSEEHTSELQSRVDLVCRLLLEK